MKFLAMACAVALAACAGKAEPRVGELQVTASPQVTDQCLRQPTFPGCRATCRLHPEMPWCWGQAPAPETVSSARPLYCDQTNMLTSYPPHLRCVGAGGKVLLCRTDGSQCR